MKIVSHKDIINLNISAKECYKWVEEVIAAKKDRNIVLPAKISIHPDKSSFCNFMPAFYQDNFLGIKLITRFQNRQPSLDSKILLLDPQNGKFIAIIDANWITAMRTGAVAAHSINLFAKKDFSSVGLIGLGNTARAIVLILSEFIKNRTLKFKLFKHKGQEKLFKNRFSHIKNFEFEFADSYIDTIKDSDVVISCATYLDYDICPDCYFQNGVTVIPVHTRGFGNCDLSFDKVFADDIGHVCHFKYFNKFKKIAEVADVIAGNVNGRENNEEKILVYNIGIALFDIKYASKIYSMLDEAKLKNIDFYSPNDKFYI